MPALSSQVILFYLDIFSSRLSGLELVKYYSLFPSLSRVYVSMCIRDTCIYIYTYMYLFSPLPSRLTFPFRFLIS